jgi:hypothetical protein
MESIHDCPVVEIVIDREAVDAGWDHLERGLPVGLGIHKVH